jgi:hypothetical protein
VVLMLIMLASVQWLGLLVMHIPLDVPGAPYVSWGVIRYAPLWLIGHGMAMDWNGQGLIIQIRGRQGMRYVTDFIARHPERRHMTVSELTCFVYPVKPSGELTCPPLSIDYVPLLTNLAKIGPTDAMRCEAIDAMNGDILELDKAAIANLLSLLHVASEDANSVQCSKAWALTRLSYEPGILIPLLGGYKELSQSDVRLAVYAKMLALDPDRVDIAVAASIDPYAPISEIGMECIRPVIGGCGDRALASVLRKAVLQKWSDLTVASAETVLDDASADRISNAMFLLRWAEAGETSCR